MFKSLFKKDKETEIEKPSDEELRDRINDKLKDKAEEEIRKIRKENKLARSQFKIDEQHEDDDTIKYDNDVLSDDELQDIVADIEKNILNFTCDDIDLDDEHESIMIDQLPKEKE